MLEKMMSTDRELLERAAKAAGISYDPSLSSEKGLSWYEGSQRWAVWNPLTDDGDALRLAVKLVERQGEMLLAWINGGVEFGDTVMCYAQENQGTDPYAATRRAIVRAAAEIGKEMK